jgi:hypothetical protein
MKHTSKLTTLNQRFIAGRNRKNFYCGRKLRQEIKPLASSMATFSVVPHLVIHFNPGIIQLSLHTSFLSLLFNFLTEMPVASSSSSSSNIDA